MHRVVIFANRTFGVPAILIRGALSAIDSRRDMVLSAVCLPRPPTYTRFFCRQILYRMLLDLESLFGAPIDFPRSIHFPVNLSSWARKFRFKVLIPDPGEINHPYFLARLRNEIQPTVALSFYCQQKFSRELLAVFDQAVNYHNGFLPMYRGLIATGWSVYRGDKETGFTFHRMQEQFDDGPILAQGAIPIRSDQNALNLDMAKAVAAKDRLGVVLGMIADGDSGVPQRGRGAYYSKNDYMAVSRIPEPSRLSWGELKKRFQAFGSLYIRIAGRWQNVTHIRQLHAWPAKNDKLCFRTADGVVVEPLRFRHHHYGLYRALSLFSGRR